MRRIHPPRCTVCNQSAAMYESDVWPTLLLCHPCHREVTSYIIEVLKVTRNNPILYELAKGTGNGEKSDGSVRVWLKNPDNSFREFWVQKPK